MPAQSVAERLAAVVALTAVVEIVTDAEVPPAGTVTVAGTVAAVLSLPRVTTRPPAGAMPVSETVPTTESTPPLAVVRLRTKESIRAGVTSRVAVLLTPRAVAVIITDFSGWLNAAVVTVKVVLDEPNGTVTEAGTVTIGSLLLSPMANPPLAGRPVKVIVPVIGDPPPTDTRESEMSLSAGGLITNVA
jgi:hypothetical protein